MSSGFSPIITIMQRACIAASKQIMRDFVKIERLGAERVAKWGHEADQRAEAILIEHLQRARPEFSILAEEHSHTTGGEQIKGQGAPFRWVIDPIDGSTNFMRGNPHFCISLALESYEGGTHDVSAGMIYMPVTQEFFWAERGKGAFKDETRLRMSTLRELDQAVMGIGNSSFRDAAALEAVHQIAQNVKGLRCSGSAALDLAFVAAGIYDGYWQKGLKAWDIAAGVLLVREAGGQVRDFHLSGNVLETGNVVACSQAIAPKLDKLLARWAKGA